MSDHEAISVGAIVIFFMLLFYMSTGTIIEKYHLKFGHEAAYTILMGMLIAFIQFKSDNDHLIQLLKFSDNTFFYFCLPPIVFASGFNMQQGAFFANIKNVMLFGVIGTFIAFFSFSAMSIYLNNMEFMWQYDFQKQEWTKLHLQIEEILLFCSLMASSDVIAAVSIVSFENEPSLFSIVFGEGITNDAVAIIMFNAVMKYTHRKDVTFTWGTPFTIMGEFTILALDSLLIGIVFGLMSSYILKVFRAFSKNAVAENMMVFCFGYLSYVTSEVAEQSGIITLLTCGIVMAHYTWYNLSPQGKQSTYIVFQFLGYATEAFVFAYLGLTFFSYSTYKWSPHFFCAEIAVIMIGRFGGTIILVAVMKMLCYDAKIPLKKQIFIWYAGMIRGAIAFGLVLRIEHTYPNRGVIVTTSLLLVIFTTVVFGSTVGLLQMFLMPTPGAKKTTAEVEDKTASEDNEKKDAKNGKNTSAQRKQEMAKEFDSDENNKPEDANSFDENSDNSSYENMQHPNLENTQRSKKQKKYYTGCTKYMHRFDELIMKPLFIYNYERNMQKKSKEFFNLFMKEGIQIEQEYTNDPNASKAMREQQIQMAPFQDVGNEGSAHGMVMSSKFKVVKKKQKDGNMGSSSTPTRQKETYLKIDKKNSTPDGYHATLRESNKQSNTYIAPAKNNKNDDNFVKTSINN